MFKRIELFMKNPAFDNSKFHHSPTRCVKIVHVIYMNFMRYNVYWYFWHPTNYSGIYMLIRPQKAEKQNCSLSYLLQFPTAVRGWQCGQQHHASSVSLKMTHHFLIFRHFYNNSDVRHRGEWKRDEGDVSLNARMPEFHKSEIKCLSRFQCGRFNNAQISH